MGASECIACKETQSGFMAERHAKPRTVRNVDSDGAGGAVVSTHVFCVQGTYEDKITS